MLRLGFGRGAAGPPGASAENQFRSTLPMKTPAEAPAILRGVYRALRARGD
jgi:hypothetical protein